MMHPPTAAIDAAVAEAMRSPCAKSQRGAAIFAGDRVIAARHNAPAAGVCDGSEACRRDCGRICIHAEQAAILAMAGVMTPVPGGNPFQRAAAERVPVDMLHIKVVGGVPIAGGPPSCAECSKLILASGIAGMWLLEERRGGNWHRYTAEEFHAETLRGIGLHGGA